MPGRLLGFHLQPAGIDRTCVRRRWRSEQRLQRRRLCGPGSPPDGVISSRPVPPGPRSQRPTLVVVRRRCSEVLCDPPPSHMLPSYSRTVIRVSHSWVISKPSSAQLTVLLHLITTITSPLSISQRFPPSRHPARVTVCCLPHNHHLFIPQSFVTLANLFCSSLAHLCPDIHLTDSAPILVTDSVQVTIRSILQLCSHPTSSSYLLSTSSILIRQLCLKPS